MPSVIALDAMGSDRAPKPEIEGAIQAARHHGVHVLLVGNEDELRAELARHPAAAGLPIEVVHASEVITMDDKAVQAVRSKRDSSIHVGVRLVREGRAAGFVTAGNTGAAMATAKMVLGAIPGVDRPALAAVFPTAVSTVAILLDVGANVDCKPENLEQFAVMGEIYFRSMFGTRRPRVGLLSIGEEESKGNELTREAFQLLKQLPLNFIGNVEGRDIYSGKVDVIVADGFVGNVALKTSEGVANLVRATLKETLKATITRQVGYLLSRSAFADFKKRLDHTEYGGAPLLGVNGVCFITHGSSNMNAIKNALRVAAEFAERNINDKIAKEVAGLRPVGASQHHEPRRPGRPRLGGRAKLAGVGVERFESLAELRSAGQVGHLPLRKQSKTTMTTLQSIAFLFPGQGSQAVGMGKELAEKYPVARQTFDEADEALGYKLSQLCFEGPEEKLRLTEITQPAILTASVAAWRVLREKGVNPSFVAGHSLGEYSAHVAAGTMSFRGCRTHRAQSRKVYAGGGPGGRRRDGRDPGDGPGEGHGSVRGCRPGRSLRARQHQFGGTDRDLRPCRGGRARHQARQRTRRQTRDHAVGQRALPLFADEAGAGQAGRGLAVSAISKARSSDRLQRRRSRESKTPTAPAMRWSAR